MERYKSLNIGCGDSTLGTNRLEITRESEATELGIASKLPYKNESFDMIFAQNILEHQPNPLEALIEWYRVLKINGKIEIITDNAGYRGWFPFLYKFQDIHGIYFNHKTHKDKHYMIFTVAHIENLMKKAGFRVFLAYLGTRWKPTLIQKFWTKISPTIGHSHIYVEGWRKM